ncbi:MAG: hypothetical protein GY870_18755 [archaeon]|nr:hypothetical protein [archaeon]
MNIYLVSDEDSEKDAEFFSEIECSDYKIVERMGTADLIAVIIKNSTFRDPKVRESLSTAYYMNKPIIGFKQGETSLRAAIEIKKMGVKFVVEDNKDTKERRDMLNLMLLGNNNNTEVHWV